MDNQNNNMFSNMLQPSAVPELKEANNLNQNTNINNANQAVSMNNTSTFNSFVPNVSDTSIPNQSLNTKDSINNQNLSFGIPNTIENNQTGNMNNFAQPSTIPEPNLMNNNLNIESPQNNSQLPNNSSLDFNIPSNTEANLNTVNQNLNNQSLDFNIPSNSQTTNVDNLSFNNPLNPQGNTNVELNGNMVIME